MSPADIRLLIMVLSEMRELVNSLELAYADDDLIRRYFDAQRTVTRMEQKLSKRISELEDLAERMEDGPQSKESN